MSDLLATKELQTLLCIDRKTVYRLLKEEQLPGARVGGQWRFPRQAIEHWLHEPHTPPGPATHSHEPLADVLPLDCFSSVQDVFAEALDVGAVTTDLEGNPLTETSNACAFCQLVFASPQGRKRCQASWRRLAETPAPPRMELCHAGLAYARARIQVADEFVGMIFAGQVLAAPAERQRLEASLSALANECSIPEAALRAAADRLRVFEPPQATKVLHLLSRVADTFSQIGQRRLDLLMRLRRVAQIASV